MRALSVRFVVAFLTFIIGLSLSWFVNTSALVEKALSYPVKTFDTYLGSPVDVPPRRVTFNQNVPTRITMERFEGGCIHGIHQKFELSTLGLGESEDATVIESNLFNNSVRHGKLDAVRYQNLLKFIEAQGYFGLDDVYVGDRLQNRVVLSVNIDGIQKDVSTWEQAGSPESVWGIRHAILGLTTYVEWEEER
jgi:hypothetical protein